VYGAGFAVDKNESYTTACVVSGNGNFLMRYLVALEWCRQIDSTDIEFTEGVLKLNSIYPPVFGIIALTKFKGTDYIEVILVLHLALLWTSSSKFFSSLLFIFNV